MPISKIDSTGIDYTSVGAWSKGGSDVNYTSGNVNIGTTSGNQKVTIWTGGTLPSAISNVQLLVGETDGFANAGIALVSSVSNGSRVSFGSTASPTLGGIAYDNTNNYMTFNTNSAERMRVDSIGRVTKPYQPVFDAYSNSANLSVTAEINLPLTSTNFNVGSHYNTSTYRFTAPVAGMYFFRAQVYKQNSGNTSRLRLTKNASDSRVYMYIPATDVASQTLSGIISLAVGDYVVCTFQSDGAGTNIYLADNHTNFSGYLLG